ncbi:MULTISPECIES: hypothetical protein [unclassified Hahella]|uniref:hypothetical protein n=1 Tax=unclassified Hahella TaxID=2624107 RepID=UPI001C1EAD41|nr:MULTISPECIES: hypothetical protein [unclassified Hahella]MBU6954578.1 hypothetical protein [Hahella sp. HN01]MDG9669205.1 hypothetical protein [Hahella sp. CR1]
MSSLVKRVSVELTESQARYAIQALIHYQEMCHLRATNPDATEDDEFFYANDQMGAAMALKSIQKASIEVFGEQILEFGHDSL